MQSIYQNDRKANPESDIYILKENVFVNKPKKMCFFFLILRYIQNIFILILYKFILNMLTHMRFISLKNI